MEDPDIKIGRLLRAALGHPAVPGTCHDCGGDGVIPDSDATKQAHEQGCSVALWKTCPTCLGQCFGGAA